MIAKSMDKYMTIRQAANAGIDTEFHMRSLCKQGNLPGFFSGNTFKVDVVMLAKQLEQECKSRLDKRFASSEESSKVDQTKEATKLFQETLVLCPYCGKKVSVPLNGSCHQKTVATCNEDENGIGCGKDFVADIRVNITANTLKIEEENE